MTKYGPIICDPTSEEAKALIGKKVVVSDVYLRFDGNEMIGTLDEIEIDNVHPFQVFLEDDLGDRSGWTFIREVIEEKPTYRPYKDTDEMISDFCERFGIVKTDFAFPNIWIKSRGSMRRAHITAYTDEYVSIEGAFLRDMHEILDLYTYLDGSPVGKEVKE